MRNALTKKALLAFGAGALIGLAGTAQAEPFMVDLTHPLPTFHATDGDITKPNLDEPWLDSTPIPTFGSQTTLTISEFPTSDGHFDLGTMLLSEHHGTHMDSAGHYVNSAESLEVAADAPRPLVHELGADDLIGRVVMIDISSRVQAELDKNGGTPSPDASVTDFSNDGPAVVGADDIAAVTDQLDDGVWLVVNTGWSGFFFEGTDFANDPYINGWNHPGLNHGAVDKLIEVMDDKGILINGIVVDNIGIDSGESAIGIDDKWTDSWYAHVRLLQRGVKFVENAANLGELAMAEGPCTLILGAPKHVRGTGGPSRVLAMCDG